MMESTTGGGPFGLRLSEGLGSNAQAEPWQGGMNNAQLAEAWNKKLPGVAPTEQDLTAFALGVEVGFAHARDLERQDWSRVHHALAKHSAHPGRTDDHLADVIDRSLEDMKRLRGQRLVLLELLGEAAHVIHNMPDEVETQEEADMLRTLKDRIADARGAVLLDLLPNVAGNRLAEGKSG
jgi:hypothetical protein